MGDGAGGEGQVHGHFGGGVAGHVDLRVVVGGGAGLRRGSHPDGHYAGEITGAQLHGAIRRGAGGQVDLDGGDGAFGDGLPGGFDEGQGGNSRWEDLHQRAGTQCPDDTK